MILKRSDALWGYVAQGLNICTGIILIPIIGHFFTVEEVSLWFVFITCASLAQLLELGFQPTIARNVSYVYAGAEKLERNGIPSVFNQDDSIVNLKLLGDLWFASKSIYRIVTFTAAIVLLFIGTIYIENITFATEGSTINYLGSWILFSAGYLITFYFGYFNAFLQGLGFVAESNKSLVYTRISQILITSVLIVSDFGMISVGIGAIFSAALGRLYAGYSFKKHISIGQASYSSKSAVRSLRKIIFHNAYKLGLVHAGSFLILRANILLAAELLGLATAASYNMTLTIMLAISSLSLVLCQVNLPRLSLLHAKGEVLEVKKLLSMIIVISITLYSILFVGVVIFGQYAVLWISNSVVLLPTSLIILMGMVQLLELNHSIFALYLTTTNKVPFVYAAISSGIAIVCLSYGIAPFLGVAGFITSQFVVQLLYNNWKWPYLACVELNISLRSLYILGLRSILPRV